jgi:adenylosuccinate synthase
MARIVLAPWKGALIVIGVQWGDEGKGKIVDHLAQYAEMVVRYFGGANAGHTVVINGMKYATRLIPSGFRHPRKIVATGRGVAHDPEVLAEELRAALEAGSVPLFDENGPVVIPAYKQIDQINEEKSGGTAIGTTRKGIGATYREYVGNRRGLRMGDLVSEERIKKALDARNFYADITDEVRRGGLVPLRSYDLLAWCKGYGDLLGKYTGDVTCLVQELLRSNQPILCEGAQGEGLDIWRGTWPFVTSSHCGVDGAISTLELPRKKIAGVIGICKAYVTRVGAGPFPTRMDNNWSKRVQKVGGEKGTVTGRPRDVGALDIVQLRSTTRDVDYLVMNKLDVLGGGDEVPICHEYFFKNTKQRVERDTTLTTELMERVEARIELMPGWTESISDCRTRSALPKAARDFVESVEKSLGKPIILGVGPDREALIWE